MFILDFFDLEKEVPVNLKKLKEQYIIDYQNLKEKCKTCELKTLRDKYLVLLLKNELF